MRQADEFLREREQRDREEKEQRERKIAREINELREAERLARVVEDERRLAESQRRLAERQAELAELERDAIKRREIEEREECQRQLIEAIREGDVAVDRAIALVGQGANVNGGIVSDVPVSPLWEAAQRGHVKMVEMLLDNGADVTVIDDKGESLLDMAIRRGYTEMVYVLLGVGAELSTAEKKYVRPKCPLEAAVDNGNAETVDVVLRKTVGISDQLSLVLPQAVCELVCDYANLCSANMLDSNGCTLLDRAIPGSKDNTKMVETLLQRGADVNKASRGMFPLSRAIGLRCSETVSLLLDGKANINAFTDTYRATALHEAVRASWPDMVGRLLASKANVNVVGEGCIPLLHLAVEFCRGETGQEKELRIAVLKKIVLADKARVNEVDREGQTLLERTIKNGDVEALEILLKQGEAGANKMSNRGILPLASIFIYKVPYYRRTDQNYYFTERDRKMAELLLENNADINAVDWDGQTPLFAAASWGYNGVGYPEAVKLFLEWGADVHTTDGKGRTVLHEVVRESGSPRRIMIAKILMHNGARLDVEDNKGRSLLDAADKDIKPVILKEQEGIDALKVCDNLPVVLENFGLPKTVGILVRDYATPLSYDDDGCQMSDELTEHKLAGKVNDIIMGYANHAHRLVLKEEIDKRKARWQRDFDSKQERLRQERKVHE